MTAERVYIDAAKRLAVAESEWMDNWYVSHSPRNDNSNAEGNWCEWVHLARLILAHPLTAEQMPDFALAYPDPAHVYSGGHPACTVCNPPPGSGGESKAAGERKQ